MAANKVMNYPENI